MTCTKDGAANEATLNRLSRFEAILAAKDAQFTVVVADKLKLTKPLAAAVTEVGLAARTCHVIAAGTPLNVELKTTHHQQCRFQQQPCLSLE